MATTIRSIRESIGMSREQLAVAAGISAPYIAKLERGEARNPSVQIGLRIADALGVDPRVLWPEESAPETRATAASR